MNERTAVWKPDSEEELSGEDLWELEIYHNTYDRVGAWPDSGTEFELESGRKVTLSFIGE